MRTGISHNAVLLSGASMHHMYCVCFCEFGLKQRHTSGASNQLCSHPAGVGGLDAEGEEDEEVAIDTGESDVEEAVEADVPETVTMETETAETDCGSTKLTSKPPTSAMTAQPVKTVPTGLPQSREELEVLITSIHHTVTEKIMPKLHKCLTARVSLAHADVTGCVMFRWSNSLIIVFRSNTVSQTSPHGTLDRCTFLFYPGPQNT